MVVQVTLFTHYVARGHLAPTFASRQCACGMFVFVVYAHVFPNSEFLLCMQRISPRSGES